MQYLFLKLLPKNLFSRMMGALSDLEAPTPLLMAIIRAYAKHYKIDLGEMKTPWADIKRFNDFFTRELKEGVRPIDEEPDVLVSPVDGALAEWGEIKDQLLLQTKGIYYSLADLVGPEEAKCFEGGHFMTLYLSPADYHRIHTPYGGKVSRFSYFSGNLWPVNKFGVEEIGGLFSINERIYTPLDTLRGRIGMVKVGATVVGKILTTYSKLTSNQGGKTALDLPVVPPVEYGKGQEIGRFQLGSTVILLMEPGRFEGENLEKGMKVKMGQRLGKLNP